MGQKPPSFSQFPPLPGAYGLFIRLDTALPISLGGRRAGELKPGTYFYGGSARGPGGMRARLARHLKKAKRKHWHIDQLTMNADITGVWASELATECQLVSLIREIPGSTVPVPHFGSSDCKACPAHLIALPNYQTVSEFLAHLGDGITWEKR